MPQNIFAVVQDFRNNAVTIIAIMVLVALLNQVINSTLDAPWGYKATKMIKGTLLTISIVTIFWLMFH